MDVLACSAASHSFVEHTKSGRIFCSKCGEFRGADADVGVISMWCGSLQTLPAAWQLCDGTGGTPDLRDKFVVGSGGGYVQGSTGGSIHCKLKADNLPQHTHYRNTDLTEEVPIIGETVGHGEEKHQVVSTHTKKVPAEPYCKKQDCREWPRCCQETNYNHSYYQREGHGKVIPEAVTVFTRPRKHQTTGQGGQEDPTPVDLRPPYFALAFIMRMRY